MKECLYTGMLQGLNCRGVINEVIVYRELMYAKPYKLYSPCTLNQKVKTEESKTWSELSDLGD